MKINKTTILFVFFIIALILFSIFSTKILLTDTPDFITVAKEFAGIGNASIHTAHSFFYPFLLSPFLKIFPSILTLKILSLFWLILDGLLIYYVTKNNKALLLWIFSPLVWITSIWIHPALPVSFFCLLSYATFKEWEKTKKNYFFVISALSLGISFALWETAIIFAFLFIIIFLYNRPFKEVLLYTILVLIGLFPRLLIEYIYLGFPFYSFIRYFGDNFIYFLGLDASSIITSRRNWFFIAMTIFLLASYLYKKINLSEDIKKISFITILLLTFALFPQKGWLLFLVLISPLFFYLYKENNLKELFFIIAIILFLSIQGNIWNFHFLLIFAPISVILLFKHLNKKEILIHILLSIIITISFLTYMSYFGTNKETLMQQDLKQIDKEYNFKKIIAGNERTGSIANAAALDSIYLGETKFLWGSDYELYSKNQLNYNEYTFTFIPKLNIQKQIKISAILTKNTKEDFKNTPMILEKEKMPPENFKLTKCYEILCLYEQ